MKVYWSRCGHGHGNFGDKLTPLLLKHFGVPVEWAPPEHAELIGVGSVLEKVPDNFKGTIWTTGFMYEASRRQFSQTRVVGLRGKLTLERVECSNREQIVLGDAGLLCDEFHVLKPKRYKLGIIPHFVDVNNPIVKQFAASGCDIRVIDICDETLDVIQAVGECEHIISSSLHGLILADTLSIPSCWLELNGSTQKVEGRGYKFRDYYSVFGLRPHSLCLKTSLPLDAILQTVGEFNRPGITAVKAALRESIELIKEGIAPLSKEEMEAKQEAEMAWHRRLAELKRIISKTIPKGASVVVADEEQFRHELDNIESIPFLERNGTYWGPPGNDSDAVAEITRQAQRGATWLIVAWPMFWLFERYPEFASFLQEFFVEVENSESARVFKIALAATHPSSTASRRITDVRPKGRCWPV